MNTNKLLNLSFLVTIVVISFFVVALPPLNVLSYDVFGYYLYLPMSFKYEDLTIRNFSTIEGILNAYHSTDTFYQAYKLEGGNWVMKYSMGMSVMYAPFYFIGERLARLSTYPADGFSLPYQLSILYGCLFYTIAGLYYFKKVLSHFFSDKFAALVFLLVVFGTNYLFHVSRHGQGAMTHNLLFSLSAFVVWQTLKWHSSYQLKQAVLIGAGIGLMTLIRPTELVAVFIPLLYGVYSLDTFKQKCLLFFKTYRLHFIVFVAAIAVLLSYQLLYLKIVTGSFLFNTYEAINAGEGFEFKQPFILETLFSFRKGWFIYTPLMALAVVGFWFLYKPAKHFFWPATVYFLINLYVVSSWSCWWYAASFSSRALISSYVVLSIPLGFFLVKVLSGRSRFVFFGLVVLLVVLNLFQSWQVEAGIIDTTYMSRDYYKSVFLQTSSPTNEQKKLLLVDKFSTITDDFTKNDVQNHVLGFVKADDFESREKKEHYTVDTISHSGKQCLITGAPYEYGPPFVAPIDSITQTSYAWIKISLWFYTAHFPDSVDATVVVNMNHTNKVYKYREISIMGKNFQPNTWNKFETFYITPDMRTTNDRITTFFWNRSKQPVFIDDFKVEVFEPKNDRSVF